MEFDAERLGGADDDVTSADFNPFVFGIIGGDPLVTRMELRWKPVTAG